MSFSPPETQSIATLAFANESWAWLAVLFSIGSVLVLILTYRSPQLRGRSKVFAILLKAAGLFLLALALLDPVVLDKQPKKQSNDIVLLADDSAGMKVALAKGQPSAADELKDLLAPSSDAEGALPGWLSEIGETFRLQPYLFNRGVRQVQNFETLAHKENHSAIAAALQSIDSRFNNRPLAATVLLTDGNTTDRALLESWLEEREKQDDPEASSAPVFPILVGTESEEARDFAIGTVLAGTTQFEDAQVTLQFDVSARGAFPDPVEAFVVDQSGNELAVKAVAFQGNESTESVPVKIRLGSVPPGISFLKVGVRQTAAEPLPEITTRNNQQRVSVDRGNGPFRILYLSGRPNWEYKFLRRSIAGDAELDLVGLIRIAKREPKFEWRGKSGESSNPLFRGFSRDVPEEAQKYDEPVLIRLNTKKPDELRDGFPKAAEEFFSDFRAIIIDDLEADFFTQEQQNLVEQFVSIRGGTVIMLGGAESFQEGSWDNTPIGRILPVYLDPLNQNEPALDAAFNLSREGWLEPWMRLRSSQEEEYNRLAYMPPFWAINRIDAIKPGASILATVTDSKETAYPALVTHRFGEGKTAAVPVADLWRWAMKDSEQQTELAKTWRQLLRWAVSEVPSRVEMTKEEDLAGALPVTRVSIRVKDEASRPQDNATVLLTVTDLEGNETPLTAEPSLEDPGLFTAEYLSEKSEGYTIKTRVLDEDGAEIGSDEVARTINPESDEFARLGPDPTLLERIAAATGGKLLRASEVDQLPSLLGTLNLPVEEIRQRPLWHTPWLFLIALLCFLGEWTIRRRQGVL